MMKEINYNFRYIEKCNMCGSNIDNHKILGKRLNRSQGKNPSKKIGITTSIVKCNNCGLNYSNPQPIPKDIQDHYGIPPESYWKESYFKIDKEYFKNEIITFNKLNSFVKGMKSLDIGAGIGKQMIALTAYGFDAYGIEPSIPFYEKAISKMNIDKNKLELKMIEDAKYPENYFDFISFGVVLEHLYDPSESIKKAMNWLKPGGLIHIEVPSSNWFIGKMINLYYKMKIGDYVGNLSPMHEPFHLHEFSLESFEIHAKNNNYNIIHHEYYTCETFMPKIFDPILKRFMKKTNSGMELCVWLKKL